MVNQIEIEKVLKTRSFRLDFQFTWIVFTKQTNKQNKQRKNRIIFDFCLSTYETTRHANIKAELLLKMFQIALQFFETIETTKYSRTHLKSSS